MKILAINPGSTSTKFAVYTNTTPLFEQTLRHSAEEIAQFDHVADQMAWRKSLIIEGLTAQGIAVADLDAVVGRGGLVKPIKGGVYEVNDALCRDCRGALHEHASNLGALLARSIADSVAVHSYIVDPVVVDEMDEVARLSGLPEFPRSSTFHALNSKAIAKRHAKAVGRKYSDMKLIVVHMGGGVSVSAHRDGRVVDTTNALSGCCSFSPERAGAIEPLALVEACFSGEYSEEEMTHKLIGGGGLLAHLGMNSMYDAVEAAIAGDAKAKSVIDAFCYNVAKDIGAMATIFCGGLDAILLTGGIAYNGYIPQWIKERVEWISEVVIYPGEDELGALVAGVLEVEEEGAEPQVYE